MRLLVNSSELRAGSRWREQPAFQEAAACLLRAIASAQAAAGGCSLWRWTSWRQRRMLYKRAAGG